MILEGSVQYLIRIGNWSLSLCSLLFYDNFLKALSDLQTFLVDTVTEIKQLILGYLCWFILFLFSDYCWEIVNIFRYCCNLTKGYWMSNNQNGGWKWNGNLHNTILASSVEKVTAVSGDNLVYFHPLTIVSKVIMRNGTYLLMFIGMVYTRYLIKYSKIYPWMMKQ